jgi:hypothetical protein
MGVNMARKKQLWGAGNYFSIELEPNKYGIGQVISAEKSCMNSVLCAFFADTIETLEMPSADLSLISIQLTTRDLLDNHSWIVFSKGDPLDVVDLFPIDKLRENDYIGAKIIGSANMAELLMAYNCLTPWNDFHQPDYLDKLLVNGVNRPAAALFK